ncbi:hypothetical protein ACH5RR_029186 [Cinchona calisaya]|uniref:Uncharacterized protein n=1 Tax=Cinchona calisaya TaxID=153742 RepID=A0ABD2YUU6_9GENT
MPIDSLINSLTSFELKLKYKVQDEKEARSNRSIALKVSQNIYASSLAKQDILQMKVHPRRRKGKGSLTSTTSKLHGMIAIRMEKLKKNMRRIKWLLWLMAIMRKTGRFGCK